MGYATFVPPPPSLSAAQLPAPGAFQFTLTAYTNRQYVVESSEDFASWTGRTTNFQTSPAMPVNDPTGSERRFYRARLAP